MGNGKIEIVPISGALGAEVHGVDLSKPLGDETFATVHQALLDYLVIFFRDQHLTPEQQKKFACRFGPLNIDRFVKPLAGHPEVLEVVKEPHERYAFASEWHSDVTFQERPPLGSILYAREVPPFGGDTLFANQYLAYETLSEGMRSMLDGMVAVHSAEYAYSIRATAKRYTSDRAMKLYQDRDDEAYEEMEHPVVRTHPETGRKALFTSPVYTLRFKDMTAAESRPLLT